MVRFLNLLRLGVRQHPEDLIIVFFLLRSLHTPATLPRTAHSAPIRRANRERKRKFALWTVWSGGAALEGLEVEGVGLGFRVVEFTAENPTAVGETRKCGLRGRKRRFALWIV